MDFVVSVNEMKEIEQYYFKKGIKSLDLMELAGKNIFLEIKKRFPLKSTSFLIVAGKGGNGGDAFVLARYLWEDQYQVQVYFNETDTLLNETRINKEKYKGEIISSITNDTYDVLVDGLYGIGLNKDLKEKDLILIQTLNKMKGYKISIDIPTGINGDTGCILKDYFHCDLCFAIQFKKRGHFLNDGLDAYKSLEVIDIQLKPSTNNMCKIITQNDFYLLYKERKHNTNKGTYGRCIFIGGCKEMPGAILLSSYAFSALKVGCGYATLGILKSLYDNYALINLENTYILFKDKKGKIVFDEKTLKKILHYDVITIGMGLSTSKEVYKILKYLCKNFKNTLIIDADGLNTLSQYGLDILKEKQCKIILTPHLMEFSRLCEKSMNEVKQNTFQLANDFVKNYDIMLILKSAVTLIMDKNQAYLNIMGSPALAKAGSGDVLAGILSGMACFQHSNLALSGALASYLLGACGIYASKELGEYSVNATDVINYIPKVLKNLI